MMSDIKSNRSFVENKRREGNISFPPLGNFSVCKTISEIKLPHLSIIIMDKLKPINSLYQEISNKIFSNNNHNTLVELL